MSAAEILANLLNAVSIFLAARNKVQTWAWGILGCLVFAYVFYGARLYADVTLQGFFVLTSAYGWWNWRRGRAGAILPVRRTRLLEFCLMAAAAILAAAGYSFLLIRYTDAAAPVWDSLVLFFSVLGQFLLMARRVENWWAWLLVDTIAVPLFYSRGLYLTAAIYGLFWVNAWFGLVRWSRELRENEAL